MLRRFPQVLQGERIQYAHTKTRVLLTNSIVEEHSFLHKSRIPSMIIDAESPTYGKSTASLRPVGRPLGRILTIATTTTTTTTTITQSARPKHRESAFVGNY
jgi:hypothetical protein